MRNEKVLVYFSDCPFFAGCENMVANFLNFQEINNSYDVYFFYRESDSYKNDLKNRLLDESCNCIGLNLPDPQIHRVILGRIKNIRILYKILATPVVFLAKYFTILYCIPLFYRKFKQADIDILHINNGGYPGASTAYSAVIAGHLSGASKIVYVVNNLAQGYKSPLRWLDKLLDLLVKQYVTSFVTGSRNAATRLESILEIPRNKVVSIPNGVAIREITLSRAEFLGELGLNLKDRPLFTTIALLEERKGHIWLLKAIKKLKESDKDKDTAPFFIFEGDGPCYSVLKNYIIQNKLQDYVIIIKEIRNIFDLMNASDAIILPSIYMEDFPNIIIEAMSLGKPVVGTRIAGIPEQIDHHKNGCLVYPRDSDGLFDSINHLKNSNIRYSYGVESKKKYNENYKVAISVKKYIQLYKTN